MTTKPAKIKYIDTLDSVSRERYEAKLSLIGGIDPYEADKAAFSSDYAGLPSISYPDIVNYFVNTQSAYTLDDLKAYKSLESYNYFVCGWVRDVKHLLACDDRVLITAKVKHSQRLNDPPLLPWVIVKQDGVILAGHCNCMAGLGEVCSHVGALVFAVEAAAKVRESQTVTQVPAYWLLPSGMSKVEYSTVQNIDFSSRQSVKRKLDISLSCGSPQTHVKDQVPRLPQIPEPTDEESAAFLDKLFANKDNAVLLSLMPGYAEHYVPSSLGEAYPDILTEMYDEEFAEVPKEEIHEHCKTTFEKIQVSQAQCDNVESETRDQSASKKWFRFRAGRITASRMKAVCATSIEKPARSLIKAICYPESISVNTKATKWGCDHEQIALDQFCNHMKISHENFKCEKSGLVINPKFPYLGASPDSIISCDCCGSGVVEVKCPFCNVGESLSDIPEKKSCLAKNNDEFTIKQSHAYYYQVQTQIFVCNKEFGYFVVWTESNMHVERIEPNEDLWKSILDKSKMFFVHVILPELIGKLYSRPQPYKVSFPEPDSSCNVVSDVTPASGSDSASDQCQGLNRPNLSQIICICKLPYQLSDDRIVRCGNEDCVYGWLHLKCLNFKRMPSLKTTWYCLECRKLPQFKNKKGVKKSKKVN